MVNPVRGEKLVEFGEGEAARSVILAFSVDAVCQLEERLGQTAKQIGERLFVDDHMSFSRAVLWAALLAHQKQPDGRPRFSEMEAGELLLEPGSARLIEGYVEAWIACWPWKLPDAATLEAANAPAGPRKPRARKPARGGTGPNS